MLENIELIVSSENVDEYRSADVLWLEDVNEIAKASNVDDVADIITNAITRWLIENDVILGFIKKMDNVVEVDDLTIEGYSLGPDGSNWINQVAQVFHYANKHSGPDDRGIALLAILETFNWSYVFPGESSVAADFMEESYQRTEESQEDFARWYAEEIVAVDLDSTTADFVDWESYAEHLSRNGYTFVEDSCTYETHVFKN
jgi:hypothetical protein